MNEQGPKYQPLNESEKTRLDFASRMGDEAAQVQIDVNDYMTSRPFVDKVGRVHEANGQFVSDKPAEEVDEYESMSPMQLARLSAEAEARGDKTTQMSVDDALTSAIEKMNLNTENTSYADKNGQTKDRKSEQDIVLDRVLGYRQKYLGELKGEQEKPFDVDVNKVQWKDGSIEENGHAFPAPEAKDRKIRSHLDDQGKPVGTLAGMKQELIKTPNNEGNHKNNAFQAARDAAKFEKNQKQADAWAAPNAEDRKVRSYLDKDGNPVIADDKIAAIVKDKIANGDQAEDFENEFGLVSDVLRHKAEQGGFNPDGADPAIDYYVGKVNNAIDRKNADAKKGGVYDQASEDDGVDVWEHYGSNSGKVGSPNRAGTLIDKREVRDSKEKRGRKWLKRLGAVALVAAGALGIARLAGHDNDTNDSVARSFVDGTGLDSLLSNDGAMSVLPGEITDGDWKAIPPHPENGGEGGEPGSDGTAGEGSTEGNGGDTEGEGEGNNPLEDIFEGDSNEGVNPADINGGDAPGSEAEQRSADGQNALEDVFEGDSNEGVNPADINGGDQGGPEVQNELGDWTWNVARNLAGEGNEVALINQGVDAYNQANGTDFRLENGRITNGQGRQVNQAEMEAINQMMINAAPGEDTLPGTL